MAVVDAEEHARVVAEVERLGAQVTERDRQLVERDQQVAERDQQVAELKAQVEALMKKVEELTEQLRRNSTNSHLPPSSDGPGATSRGVRPPKKRKGTKRKQGGQKGRRGSRRQLLPPERVHEFVNHFPDACERCASELSPETDADAQRYQLVDLRDGALHVTEHRRHTVRCERCGRSTIAAYDHEAIPLSPFGPGLVTGVAMLTGVYHLSRREAQRLLRDFFRLKVSVGAISSMEARASKALISAVEEARRDVEAAPVKHADATSWLLAGITMSLWTLSTALTTFYRIFEDGRRKTIKTMFGNLIGILVSDRASVFGFWEMALRQICWAHLLRAFISFAQRDGPVGAFGRELLDCAALVFEYWHGFKKGLLTREELSAWMRPVQRQFEATLRRAVAADHKRLSGSCADILAHREALWTFVVHEGVEPTNNLAERDLRPLVLWRKRSHGCRSERGLRFAERIMTVAQTLGKRGKHVFEFVREAVTAHLEGRPQPSLLAA